MTIDDNVLEKDEVIKPIDNFPDYYVSNLGNVYSAKGGKFKKLKPFLDSKGNYMNIRINNKTYLLHRLVAIAFIPNPDNLPEVNHKDKNKKNCNVTNLEWCTRKENLNDSYKTMSPTRNYRICYLFKGDEKIGPFQGVAKAARYAQNKYGASFSALDKYLKSGEFRIEYEGEQSRKTYDDHLQTKNYVKGNIKLYKNGYRIYTCKSFPQLEQYFNDVLRIPVKERTLHSHCNIGKEYKGYIIKRDK